MAKILIMKGDDVLWEASLVKDVVTVGRGPHNDIVLDSPAISAEHAILSASEAEPFLEDLNSTNGTQVNGQPVRKHYLQHRDVIELADYRIHYFRDAGEGSWAARPVPRLQILDGASAGKEMILSKALTTIGKPEDRAAVIGEEGGHFFLMYVMGEEYPLVNQQAVRERRTLAHGDVIDFCGVRMRFMMY